MRELQGPDDVVAYNEESLRTLSRAIVLSKGRFSLILARCNYAELQDQIQQRLRERCPIPIRELVLHGAAKTLYTLIKTELGDEQPQALMIVGLNSVIALDDVLTATNQVRDDFRKSFSFPLILWVNDEILQKLGRLAPDFNSWAGVPIRFAIATADLIQLLQHQTDTLFKQAMQVGAGRFPRSSALYLESDSYTQPDLKVALKELQQRQQPLDPALKASLLFILALDAHANERMEQAYLYYQQSLAFWQSASPDAPQTIERWSCVLFYLGLWWRRQAALHRDEYEADCRQALDCYRQCVDKLLQTHREQLAARFIIALGEVLQRLGEWNELATVAQTTVRLHQTYFDPICLAYGYGLLAEVALARSAWQDAKSHAEKALQVNEQPPDSAPEHHDRYLDLHWARPHYRSLYLLLLAQAEQQLGKLSKAVEQLEVAKENCNHAYDPLLYTRILEALRSLYYQQGEYLQAFETKQEQRSIEQQYGLRAFIGAGRLKAERQVISPALVALELSERDATKPNSITPPPQPTAIAQEIAASGRQQDVERLMIRLSSTQYRLTVIHGQSGVGKSSIINAGLVPALEQQPIEARNPLPIVLSVYTDWTRELGNCLIHALAKRGICWGACDAPQLPDPQFFINEFHNNADRWSVLPILIFDQFEEFFFIYPDAASRRDFFQFFKQCLDLPYVKVVLSLREDYLHYLLECERLHLDEITSDILGRENRYPLGNFSIQDAKLIIQRLTCRSQFMLEPDLIEQLVNDMAQESGDVRPIELQIVGAQLQEENITKLHQYQSLGEHPKQQLVERFLEQVVQDCGPPNQQAANLILFLLTDEKGTRPLKTLLELTENLSKLAVNLIIEADRLDLVLTILVRSGIVLLLPESPAARYQLVHDYLVTLIRQKQQPVLLEQISELQQRGKQQEDEIQQLQKDKELLEARAREAELQKGLLEAQTREAKLQAGLKRTKRERRLASAVAGMGVLLAIFTGGFGTVAYSNAKRAAIAEIQAKTSESSARAALGDNFQALLASVQAVNQLRDRPRPLSMPVEVEALVQLQRSLFSVQEYNRLIQHDSWVTQVSFSQDRRFLVSSSADRTVRLWSVNGELLDTAVGHKHRVNSVSISPDGQIVASASDDKTVRLWRVEGTKLRFLRELTGHEGYVNSVSISPDGQTVASGSDDGTMRLWSIAGQQLKELPHSNRVQTVSFSPDGQMLASASWDGTVTLWNREGMRLNSFSHGRQVTMLSFSPDGQTIASGSVDDNQRYSVKLWNREGQPLQTLEDFTDLINGISFTPDGATLAVSTADGAVKVWQRDQQTGKFDKEPSQTLNIDRVTSVSFAPDGTLASTDAVNTIRFWKLQGTKPTIFEGNNSAFTSISFSPDRKTIAVGEAATASLDGQTATGKLTLWNFEQNQPPITLPVQGSVDNVSFSPDGNTIASTENPHLSINIAENGRIITSTPSGVIRLLNLHGRQLRSFDVSGQISSVSFNPKEDTNIIAAAVNSIVDGNRSVGRILVWQLDGTKLLDFRAHDIEIRSISFSPDGKTIASGGADNVVRFWNLNGEELKELQGHAEAITSIRFSRDGRMLASASEDNTIRIWSREGKFIRSLEGHTDSVNSIDFSRDNQLLISSSDDRTIKLWDTETSAPLATLGENKSTIRSVSFSPYARIIASVSNNAIKLWNFDSDVLLSQSCDWLENYVEQLPPKEASSLCPRS